jgi:glyoxylase-like metal-dependent hydrolase (beta-lactamase superfamily II)
MEEILPGLYRIKIPLPRNPLKYVNSYVIKDGEWSLVIDTGLNRKECMAAMREGLKELGIDPQRIDVFITHFHEDHMGLVPSLATGALTVNISQTEADIIAHYIAEESDSPWWAQHSDFLRARGFPEDELPKVVGSHPDRGYEVSGGFNVRTLKDGDVINAGVFSFECIETPGHSPGHVCLYESREKILISGDHILGDITPIIALWSDEVNSLKDYLASLEKVQNLDVGRVLPGHGSTFENFRQRIEELKIHHRRRADEIVDILQAGVQNAMQVASQMSWDIPEPWDRFPPSQKWFAFGETLAHLKYLEEEERIKRRIQDGIIVFGPA